MFDNHIVSTRVGTGSTDDYYSLSVPSLACLNHQCESLKLALHMGTRASGYAVHQTTKKMREELLAPRLRALAPGATCRLRVLALAPRLRAFALGDRSANPGLQGAGAGLQ